MTTSRRQFLRVASLAASISALGTGLAGQALAQAAPTVEQLMAAQPLPDVWLGKDDAPVTIIEYASMTCPHCATFHNTTFKELKTRYIDTGKVRFTLREFPFDPRATAAFMLARCVGDDKRYAMVDVLFQRQEEWAGATDARPPLQRIAALAGLPADRFESCLKDSDMLTKVRGVFAQGEGYGVKSTPTFFINGEQVSGAQSIDDLAKLIDKHL